MQFQKFTPKKLNQAADEIFRVAAWTRSELGCKQNGLVSDELTPKN